MFRKFWIRKSMIWLICWPLRTSAKFSRLNNYSIQPLVFLFFTVFLNLSSILLRFTLPICQGVGNPKMIKIDPTYTSMDCKVSEDSFLKNVHLRNVKDETFLLPSTEEEKENDSVPDQYNFVTDIFFLAHKSLDLGFRVCHEKFVKMNQELGRLQQGKHPKTNLPGKD